MKSVFVKERKKYGLNELSSKFGMDKQECNKLIRLLYGINIINVNSESNPIISPNIDQPKSYQFNFVGFIVENDLIIKCIPKYIESDTVDDEYFQLILKSIRKSDKTKRRDIYSLNDFHSENSQNGIALRLFLMLDFFEMQSLKTTEYIIGFNKNGEILWDQTIHDTIPILIDEQPCYWNVKTRKSVNNESDYFARLHACVVTRASSELKNLGLLQILGLNEINISQDDISNFGSTEYIIYKLRQRLTIEYNDRQRNVLNALIAYFGDKCFEISKSSFYYYGTRAFNLVWQDACSIVYNDIKDKKLKELPFSKKGKYLSKLNNSIKDLMPKTYWSFMGQECGKPQSLDFVFLTTNDDIQYIIIGDAKYYIPKINGKKEMFGMPGIEDVVKEYSYQMALEEFIEMHHLIPINAFFLPLDGDDIIDFGYAELDMFQYRMSYTPGKDFKLENIKVVKIPARKILNSYLKGEKRDIKELNLF